MDGLLCVKNLSVTFEDKIVLDNISFTLGHNKILSVIGQNGCGKSTLVKVIARLITNNTGNIKFNKIEINKKNTWDLNKLGISFFFQGSMVISTLRVKEHFKMILQNKNKTEANFIKEKCLEYFPRLAYVMNKVGGNLSGGEKQMLSFSMLIAQQPKCLVLDEPMAGLSPDAVNIACNILMKMKKEEEISMLLIEHNYSVAYSLADNLFEIKEGKILYHK